jgi:phosphoribosylformimino-5-aminoimidazole carboxamide ribotide isomerase
VIPIPAIDLKGGKVVRLLQGKFEEEKVYFDRPDVVARRFEEEGATRIHVVDLDGALKGTPKNMDGVESILKVVKTPVEVGGGIRDLKTIGTYFKMGVQWVVLGTKACLDKGFMEEALAEHKGKVIVGLDALGGYLATDGWTKVTEIRAIEFAQQVQQLGGEQLIYTDISKDGVLAGPSFSQIKTMAQSVSIDVIASGGVGSLEDLRKIMDLGLKNIVGVIIGKALYENRLTLRDAVKLCLQKG